MLVGVFDSSKMISNPALPIFVTLVILRTATGFMCYKCSYSIWSEGSVTNCIDDPESLGAGDRLFCNSTSYCVFSERYRISDGKIISYFRTCSGTPWGNGCDPSQSHLTCKGSCQGNFCNVNDRGDRHVEYLEQHRGDIFGNHAANNGKEAFTFAFCITALLKYL